MLYEIIYIVLRIKFINYHMNKYNIVLTKKEKLPISIHTELSKDNFNQNANKLIKLYDKLNSTTDNIKNIQNTNLSIPDEPDYNPIKPSIFFKKSIRRIEKHSNINNIDNIEFLINPKFIPNENMLHDEISSIKIETVVYKTPDELLNSGVSTEKALQYFLKYVSYILYIYMKYILNLLFNSDSDTITDTNETFKLYKKYSSQPNNSFELLEQAVYNIKTNTLVSLKKNESQVGGSQVGGSSNDASIENETYKKISLDMTQTQFQREVGRLEVLGELLIREK